MVSDSLGQQLCHMNHGEARNTAMSSQALQMYKTSRQQIFYPIGYQESCKRVKQLDWNKGVGNIIIVCMNIRTYVQWFVLTALYSARAQHKYSTFSVLTYVPATMRMVGQQATQHCPTSSSATNNTMVAEAWNINDWWVRTYLSCICFYCFHYSYSLMRICLFRSSTVQYQHQQCQHVYCQDHCQHVISSKRNQNSSSNYNRNAIQQWQWQWTSWHPNNTAVERGPATVP